MTLSEHQREDRGELEDRFRILSHMILSAREASAMCTLTGCPACLLIRAAIELPETVRAGAHPPREDLERAVEAIAERVGAVVHNPNAASCAGARPLIEFHERCRLAYIDEQGARPADSA